MSKLLSILLIGGVLMGCSFNSYMSETRTIYQEKGLIFSLKVRPKQGIIYTAGPFIDFIAENNGVPPKDLYLTEVVLKMADREIKFYGADYYTNNHVVDARHFLPVKISKDGKWIGSEKLPEPNIFKNSKIPCSLQVKFSLNGVEKVITNDFEISTK